MIFYSINHSLSGRAHSQQIPSSNTCIPITHDMSLHTCTHINIDYFSLACSADVFKHRLRKRHLCNSFASRHSLSTTSHARCESRLPPHSNHRCAGYPTSPSDSSRDRSLPPERIRREPSQSLSAVPTSLRASSIGPQHSTAGETIEIGTKPPILFQDP